MSVKLYVGGWPLQLAGSAVSPGKSNIPWATTQEDLRGLFSQFGEVEDAFIPQDRESGRPRGFAFVTMGSGHEAAISALNETDFQGRTIRVNEAQPPGERPAYRGGGGFGGRGGGRGGFGGGGYGMDSGYGGGGYGGGGYQQGGYGGGQRGGYGGGYGAGGY